MEHKKEDLDGDIELSVVLPNSSIVNFTVKQRLPLMDLLVLVSSKHHLKPSEHMIQPMSENNTVIRSTPNTPVGALKARYVQILQKHVMEEPQPAPPVAPPRRNALPNISSTLPPKHKPDVKSLDPQKLLLSFRLLVHLPNNQLHVMRVTPDMTINDILVTVQDAKNLNINNFSVRNKHNPGIELDFNNTLAHYQIKELVLERKTPPVPLTHSRTSLQPIEPSTSAFKSGLRSFFTNMKLSSGKNRHKLSLREGQIKQPVVQKKVQNVLPKEPTLIPQEGKQPVITPINRPKPPPRKRHAPPPPIQQIKDSDTIGSQISNKPEVGNGVVVQDVLPVLPTSGAFEDRILQCDVDSNETQKKQLVRQLAVDSGSSSIESAKEDNPKILSNENTLCEHSENRVIEFELDNRLRSESQSISHVTIHPKESNNVNNGECTSYTDAHEKYEDSNNSVNVVFSEKYPQSLLQMDSNTEVTSPPPNFITNTVISEISDQMTEKQYLDNFDNRTEEHSNSNVEKNGQVNTVIETPKVIENTILQVESDISPNFVETNQFTMGLAAKMETNDAELRNDNVRKSARSNKAEENSVENKILQIERGSTVDNHVREEQLHNECLENTEIDTENLIKKKESPNENIRKTDETDVTNVLEKNKLKNENQENVQKRIEKYLIETGKLNNVTQKSIIGDLTKENLQNNDLERTMTSSTDVCDGGYRNITENVRSPLEYKSTYVTSGSPTILTDVSIDRFEKQCVFEFDNSKLPVIKPRSVINNKDNFTVNKKPLSKASSDLNVSTIGKHTPRFLLTSWSSDKVPKVVRIADDTTHGSSAYSQNATSASSAGLDEFQTAEKPFSGEPLQSKTEQFVARPVVVSVIRKDPNCSPSKINNHNGNVEKVHHNIGNEVSKEVIHTSRSTSSYAVKSISTPPKIQSWELVNAIEKMLKKNSNNETNNSSRKSEKVQSGSYENNK